MSEWSVEPGRSAWQRILDDPKLAAARKKLSIHEIRLILRHGAAADGGLRDEFVEANSLLRSAYSIATREGADTHWDAFRAQVIMALERQLPIVNAINTTKQENANDKAA